MQQVVAKLAEHAPKAKQRSNSPYLFHLYQHQEVLSHQELVQYQAGLDMAKYGLVKELQNEEKVEEDPAPMEAEEPLADKRQRKSTDPRARGKAVTPDRGETSRGSKLEGPVDFFRTGFKWMETAQRMFSEAMTTILTASEELDVLLEDIVDTIRKRPSLELLQQKDEEIRKLTAELEVMRTQVEWTEVEATTSKQREDEALKIVQDMRAITETLEQIVIQSKLYDN